MKIVINFFIPSIVKQDSIKNTLCALIIFIFSPAAFCQPTDSAAMTKRYHVNYVTGSAIIAVGLATDAFAISRIKNKPKITEAELLALNTNIIDPIDRWALHQDPGKRQMYSKVSDYSEPPLFILLPALLGLDKKIRKEWFKIIFMYKTSYALAD